MAYRQYTLLFLPIVKRPKNTHAQRPYVTTNIGLPSRLVTCRLWPRIHCIHLRSLTIAAPSCRCFACHRGAALYSTTHYHGSCVAALAGYEESVDSCRDSMYVLPSMERDGTDSTLPSASDHYQHH